MADDLEQWTCPICLELTYKPCVNRCGHIFCFWCMHKSMVLGHRQNNCPYCRQIYWHFPAVCEALHAYLKNRFPAEWHRREASIKDEEASIETESFAVEEILVSDQQKNFYATLFSCVSCKRLAEEASVLVCGHLVCNKQGCIGKVCAKCSSRIVQPPSPCKQIRDLISSFGTRPGGQETAEASTNRAANAVAEKEKLPPDGNQERDLPLSEFQDDQTADVHYGVGCDGLSCGMLPIRGRRYRCLDCPESIGYDLCGACYDHSLESPNLKGRFNQSHKSDHCMELTPCLRIHRITPEELAERSQYISQTLRIIVRGRESASEENGGPQDQDS